MLREGTHTGTNITSLKNHSTRFIKSKCYLKNLIAAYRVPRLKRNTLPYISIYYYLPEIIKSTQWITRSTKFHYHAMFKKCRWCLVRNVEVVTIGWLVELKWRSIGKHEVALLLIFDKSQVYTARGEALLHLWELSRVYKYLPLYPLQVLNKYHSALNHFSGGKAIHCSMHLPKQLMTFLRPHLLTFYLSLHRDPFIWVLTAI